MLRALPKSQFVAGRRMWDLGCGEIVLVLVIVLVIDQCAPITIARTRSHTDVSGRFGLA
jgi:hypothetical protein